MKFRTEVEIPEYPFKIDHKFTMLMLGSCFTDNIGEYLTRYLFHTTINPFGVIYNPLSVKKAITALLEKDRYDENDLEFHNGLYFSFDHYTKFSHPDKSEALERINNRFFQAKEKIRTADLLIITFGTAWVFRYNKNNQVVCNCHKIPAAEFTRELLTVDQVTEEYQELIDKLLDHNKDLKIIFTISPVRHLKDGAHGNQISKSSLLLAVEQICSSNPSTCHYFPAYEIIMDDLRDYRFYSKDLVHPNDQAVQYLWNLFSSAAISQESLSILSWLDPLIRSYDHKPVHGTSEAHQKFLDERSEKLKIIKREFPHLNWSTLKV